jgi:2-polyprenyl-3-methyl-5-hydroxy-6-metoxy-1,4-benzoquinol methylase
VTVSGNNQSIRTQACPQCYLCGATGKLLYSELTDQLFSAPGVWDLKQCTDAVCGLIWLDPTPIEEDIALAYRRYYTHQNETATENTGIALLAYRILAGVSIRATGIIKEQRSIRTRYLGGEAPGKLLEIGCGAGDYIALMRTLGWTVEGVETDHVACRYARQTHTLTVHEGTLESKGYPENSFDAIVMNHVIEHVFDPVTLLKECRRIVKPGGRVIVITPNSGSWGHRTFRKNWRGLEPPRHIHVFSPTPLKKCANLACFEQVTVTTTPANADIIIKGSMDIRKNIANHINKSKENIIQKIVILFLQIYEYVLWKYNPGIGEEIVMTCKKL